MKPSLPCRHSRPAAFARVPAATGSVATAIGMLLLCGGAQAQAPVPWTPVPVMPGTSPTLPSPPAASVTTPSTLGTFSVGSDDCNTAHTNIGTGNQFGVPVTYGTTGTTGQNEAHCSFAGGSGIDRDVWFDWTADTTGTAFVYTCLASADTKVAVWPLSTCPADGTSLACNDDYCGSRAVVWWSCTAGTTYTIQFGLSPGRSYPDDEFSVYQLPTPPCGQKDDGSSENAFGSGVPAELGWMTVWETGPSTCLAAWDSVETAYGSLMFPGSVTNGMSSRVAVYRDADTDKDPTTGLTLLVDTATVVTNGCTDIFNKIPLGTTIDEATDGDAWALVTVIDDGSGFPAPLDETPPTDAAGTWLVGTNAPGILDLTDLPGTGFPQNMASLGYPGNWLLRVVPTTVGGGPGTPVCFGDGSGTACPCDNSGSTGHGCANGTGDGGVLTASGSASVTNDTMTLTADGVINDSGIFFQGNNTIGGGSGVVFGDGLRCCGGSTVRIQIVNPPGTTSPATAQMTETATTNGPAGTITAGTKKCYQYWYRDTATSPCGNALNLTNAVSVTWEP